MAASRTKTDSTTTSVVTNYFKGVVKLAIPMNYKTSIEISQSRTTKEQTQSEWCTVSGKESE